MLPKLNFPEYSFRFKKNEKGVLLIFDIIRKKFIELSPEEWVRQHLIAYLITDKNYPIGLFKVENTLKLNNTKKRTDILIYNTQKTILILAECKSPSIKLSIQTAEQALRYNITHKSSYIILSNGLSHLVYKINSSGQTSQISNIPDYEAIKTN